MLNRPTINKPGKLKARLYLISTQLFILLSLFGVSGCWPGESNIVGRYVAVGYQNTIDTIVLKPTHVYERQIYDKSGEFLSRMTGTWEYEKGAIVLNSFFLNLDRDLKRFPELLEDTDFRMEANVDRSLNGISFCTGYWEGEHCYRKI